MKNACFEKIDTRFFIDRDILRKGPYKGSPHYHNECEIFYFLKGEARYFVHNKCYTVKEGDIVFVDTYEIHKALYTSDGCERIIVLYHPSMAETGPLLKAPDIFQLLNEKFNGNRLITPASAMKKDIQDTMNKMLECYCYMSSSPFQAIYSSAYFTIFMTQIADFLYSINMISSTIDSPFLNLPCCLFHAVFFNIYL